MRKLIKILILILFLSQIAYATPRDDLMADVQDPNQMSMVIGDPTFQTQSLRLLSDIQVNTGSVASGLNLTGINGVAPSINNGPTDAGTLRVSIANGSTGTVGVNNFPVVQPVSGSVSILTTASGGATTFHRISTAGTNATLIKGSSGNVFSVQFFNTTGAIKFVKFYSKATAPIVGVDIPVKTIGVRGNDERTIVFGPTGVNLPLGVGIGMTTGALDNNATPVGVGDIIADIDYK